ncbi:nuclear transport factor 2 family protein [Herbiconiux moechotypicola]|uniref:SnoaL-like domain-containing protein n=1 Tax=Herbiconiux moechotypicola TaxID=637393 RepID=A0ABN3DLD3_9MICO|nr:nuclear transport factor 2 family protein [Herbiconiux moechotypicola]MCS5730152.1 nuclear transport factor 2 family protein [Herbiconiux moechotypicola]
MPTIPELLATNLHDVFGNRDAASRRAAIEASFSPEVVFIDPEETVTGWDALEAKAAGLLATAPDSFEFREDGVLYTGDGVGALAWTFGPEGTPVARGIDIVTVADSRIVELRTLLHE